MNFAVCGIKEKEMKTKNKVAGSRKQKSESQESKLEKALLDKLLAYVDGLTINSNNSNEALNMLDLIKRHNG